MKPAKKITPIERKRWELWAISFLLLLASGGTVIALGVISNQPPVIIIFLGVFFLLFCAYIIDSEFKIQKMQNQLRDEQFSVLEETVKNSALQARLKELTALQQAMAAVGAEAEPQKGLDTILRAAMDFFGADRGSIMLVNEANQTLVIASSIGINPEFVAQSRPKIGEGIAGRVVQTGDALLLPTKLAADQYKNFEIKSTNLRSGICAPLRRRNKIIGVINYTILDTKKRLFNEYDLKLLLIFAQYATLVIETAGAARPR